MKRGSQARPCQGAKGKLYYYNVGEWHLTKNAFIGDVTTVAIGSIPFYRPLSRLSILRCKKSAV